MLLYIRYFYILVKLFKFLNMGLYNDFAVKYDKEKDSQEDLVKRILYSIFIRRIKMKKPVVVFVGGESGSGKSLTVLKLQKILLEMQGESFEEHMADINVVEPIEYMDKLNKIIYEKKKKVNVFAVHESRVVVNAKQWQQFSTQAVAHVTTMSRAIKRLIFFIVSQDWADITTDIRRVINYRIMVQRVARNKPARIKVEKIVTDNRDIENPKKRAYRINGFLVYPNGRYRKYRPDYFEIDVVDKDIALKFEKMDTEGKIKILEHKMQKFLKDISGEYRVENPKLAAMIKYYTDNLDMLGKIGKKVRSGWRLNKYFNEMHDLTKEEAKLFEIRLNDKLKDMGVMENE